MAKGIRIIHLIGYILEALMGLGLLFFFVICLLISMPSSRSIIEQGIQDHIIAIDPALSLEENINSIQTLFIYFTIVLFVFMAAYIANTVICFVNSKHQDNRKLIISSLILSVVGFNPLLIVANSLLLKNYGVEVIEVK